MKGSLEPVKGKGMYKWPTAAPQPVEPLLVAAIPAPPRAAHLLAAARRAALLPAARLAGLVVPGISGS